MATTLSRALCLTRANDAADLVESGELYVAPRTTRPSIAVSPRVGVAYAGAIAEAPWRFYDSGSRHVSRPSPKTIGLGLRGSR